MVLHKSGKEAGRFRQGVADFPEPGHVPEHAEEFDRFRRLHVRQDRGDHGQRLEQRQKRERQYGMPDEETKERLSLYRLISEDIGSCRRDIIVLLFSGASRGLAELFIRLGFDGHREHLRHEKTPGDQKTDRRHKERGHHTAKERQDIRCAHKAVAYAVEMTVDRDIAVHRIRRGGLHTGHADDEHDQEDRQKSRLGRYDGITHAGDEDRDRRHKKCERDRQQNNLDQPGRRSREDQAKP